MNVIDWSRMLTPPKPISPLEMMVFMVKLIFVPLRSMIPRVISIQPDSIEDTTSVLFCK